MNCRADGNPAPAIEWYRNGKYVKPSKDDATAQPTLLPDGSLFFLRLSQEKGKSDEGVYHCLARNHLGKAMSKNASLYLEVLEEEFRLHPNDLKATIGEPWLLQCVPPLGHPEPTVSWKKNGVPISPENGHYEFSKEKLLVAYAQKSDAGTYTCLAVNQAGEQESRAATVTVLERPTFIRKPSDVVASVGSSVQFICGIRGDPKLVVQWYKEDGDLPSGRQMVLGRAGPVYFLIITTIIIIFIIIIIHLSRNLEIFPLLFYSHKNSERYEVDQENVLQIHHLTMCDTGKYICAAYSHGGTIFAKASLTVEDPLDPRQKDWNRSKDVPKELMDTRVCLVNVTIVPSAPAAHLHWKVTPTSQPIEAYKVFYRSLLPAKAHWAEWDVPRDQQTIIPGLERGYKYEFKVRPYLGKIHGIDSNVRQLYIPEKAGLEWEIWFLGNETHPGFNRTVDGDAHNLETTGLPSGHKYCVKVAAVNGAGVGVASNPVCVTAGLYRNASDDTIIKHRKSHATLFALCVFIPTAVSFDRQSQGSRIQTVPLVPDSSNSSPYGAFRVNLPAKDLKTFYSSLPYLSNPNLQSMALTQAGELMSHGTQNLRTDRASGQGRTQQGPWKAAGSLSPNRTIRGSWARYDKKGKAKPIHQITDTYLKLAIDKSLAKASLKEIKTVIYHHLHLPNDGINIPSCNRYTAHPCPHRDSQQIGATLVAQEVLLVLESIQESMVGEETFASRFGAKTQSVVNILLDWNPLFDF
ncbi:hypothetical protein Chor_002382 [Crotalus horridus]